MASTEGRLIRLISRLLALRRFLGSLADRDIRRNAQRAIRAYRMAPAFDCPCCGYRGRFDFAGDTLHANAECPACHAMDRHRLIALAMRAGFVSFAGKEILHFAPEPALVPLIEAQAPARYQTADLAAGTGSRTIDITAIDAPDASVDLVLAVHVLEHVDDGAALKEIRRILRPRGEALLMVPVAEGWAATFEDDAMRLRADRHRYFAQFDHLRYYGADLRDRLRSGGFDLDEFTADGRQCGEMGLARGETLFRIRPK